MASRASVSSSFSCYFFSVFATSPRLASFAIGYKKNAGEKYISHEASPNATNETHTITHLVACVYATSGVQIVLRCSENWWFSWEEKLTLFFCYSRLRYFQRFGACRLSSAKIVQVLQKSKSPTQICEKKFSKGRNSDFRFQCYSPLSRFPR